MLERESLSVRARAEGVSATLHARVGGEEQFYWLGEVRISSRTNGITHANAYAGAF